MAFVIFDGKQRKLLRWKDGGLLVFEYAVQAENYASKKFKGSLNYKIMPMHKCKICNYHIVKKEGITCKHCKKKMG